MITQMHVPGNPLNKYIDHFFYYSGFNPEHKVDRFLPDGDVQIIIDLTDEPKYIYDNTTLKEIQSCKRVWFSGFRTEPITIPSGKESEMLIIQFHKGKAAPFLSEPMVNLTDCVVDAELVLNSDILDIRDSLYNEKTPGQKLRRLEKELTKCYLKKLHENPFVNFAVSRIVSSPALCSIKEIAGKSGYSQKHLIKIFKDQVGVTPKEFLRVIRFQKVISEIEQHKTINWPVLALDCGYYDQSHFIADFRRFSGFTPADYLKQRGEFLNYIPIK